MPAPLEQFANALRLAAPGFGIEMDAVQIRKLTDYYDLLIKWNPRLHLVAPCSPKEFATRHVLESLMLLRHLPANASIVDIGSGGGLPMIPCLLVRDDLHATLIESSSKKAVFLREALRPIRPSGRARIVIERFEKVAAPNAGFVTCRALEKFAEMIPIIIEWAPPSAIFLLFAGEKLRAEIESRFKSVVVERLPQSEARFLVIGQV
ncbi:MAG TPA: 16S rRNA (guanine(527)-N(7))-methyltransferase RsmG [Pyrinomonadaceae bacterium]|nr:16S rRNA (guanine(527)-N(7))-methyltransferase RsmG [Pyrinomonadaceae bacterium]